MPACARAAGRTGRIVAVAALASRAPRWNVAGHGQADGVSPQRRVQRTMNVKSIVLPSFSVMRNS